jgi:glutaredoxin-like YruB-family protein
MKVIVYSTSICPFCDEAKAFLKKNKIKFSDINVNEDKKAAMQMMVKSGQNGVPVIDIDGQVVIGFDKAKLKQILKLK